MTIKEVTLDFIRAYCVENKQTAWYNEFVTTEISRAKYPKIVNENGKKVDDKTATPSIVKSKPTFLELRKAFVDKFMPELMPKKKESGAGLYSLL